MNTQQIIELLSEDFFKGNAPENIDIFLKSGSISIQDIERRSMAFEPADISSIEEKEKKLGIKLPPSYKDFLLVSNGFKIISPFLDNLFSIEKIDWARNLEEKWSIDMFNEDSAEVSDEEYFYYEDDQDSLLSRTSYIPESLKVSEWYDGMCVFLNPFVKFGDEWEVLEYATWFPGVQRYKSFLNYLLKTHLSNQRLIKNKEGDNIS